MVLRGHAQLGPCAFATCVPASQSPTAAPSQRLPTAKRNKNVRSILRCTVLPLHVSTCVVPATLLQCCRSTPLPSYHPSQTPVQQANRAPASPLLGGNELLQVEFENALGARDDFRRRPRYGASRSVTVIAPTGKTH